MKTKFKVGDKVKALRDCGHVKAGQVYEVVEDNLNYLKQKKEPYLAIAPKNIGKVHVCCNEQDNWKLVSHNGGFTK